MGKEKRKSMNESQNGDEAEEQNGMSYDEHMKYVSVIAQPMASEDLTKKVQYPGNLRVIRTTNVINNV